MTALGGKRTLAPHPNSLPKLVLNHIPLKHLASCLLHREPTHKSAAAYIVATLVPLAVEAKDVKSIRLGFWNNEVTERYG